MFLQFFLSLSFPINCIVFIRVKRKSSASFFCSPTFFSRPPASMALSLNRPRHFVTLQDESFSWLAVRRRFLTFLEMRSKVDVSSPSSLVFSTVTLWRSLWEKNRAGGAAGPAVESFLGRPQRPAGISNQPYSKSKAQSPTRSSAASINYIHKVECAGSWRRKNHPKVENPSRKFG